MLSLGDSAACSVREGRGRPVPWWRFGVHPVQDHAA